MFNKGDIIVGKYNNGYGVTSENALMIVLNQAMEVLIIAHTCYSECRKTFCVTNSESKFQEITVKEYFELHPDAALISQDELEYLLERWYVDIDMSVIYDKKVEQITPYELSSETRAMLYDEMETFLKKYGYKPTEIGLNAIIDLWATRKANLIRMFEKHPKYNGKFQIVFDADYERELDVNEIYKFTEFLCYNTEIENLFLVDYTSKPFTYEECRKYKTKYECITDMFYSDYITSVNGLTRDEAEENYEKWKTLERKIRNVSYSYGNRRVTRESYNLLEKFKDVINGFRCYYSSTLDAEFSAYLNNMFPELKAKEGQKTSRAINKICTMFGVNKITDYNKMFAKYSDAINPLTIKRYTVLSVHPIDFYTMSFGNSWSTCHSIDKMNIRDIGSYEGRYSGGTESYMLDKTSMVFYTVDKDYDGTEFELQDKIQRNMFHYGKDKLIQGRVYPQKNDDYGVSLYKQFRETVQKIISECNGSINSWLNIKGTDECRSVIYTQGAHYPDYLNFENCNVSYFNKEKNTKAITVGSPHICPTCGEIHTRSECIACGYCY